ncbi:putative NAD(P)-binding-domain-containing protein [Dipodascopsis uninucleata]
MENEECRVEYSDIPGGGSLLVAYQLQGKPVTVIGGGDVATGRVGHLLAADAIITVICPESGLTDELKYRISKNQIRHISRKFDAKLDLDVQNLPSMVLAAVDDYNVSTDIYKACKSLRIPVNVADVPTECDFYFGSMYRDGPLQVMVSTNGNGPKMANLVRRKIENELQDEPLGLAIENMGKLRKSVRKVLSGQDKHIVKKRMKLVSELSEQWTISQLAQLDDAMIKEVTSKLGSNEQILTFADLRI